MPLRFFNIYMPASCSHAKMQYWKQIGTFFVTYFFLLHKKLIAQSIDVIVYICKSHKLVQASIMLQIFSPFTLPHYPSTNLDLISY